MYDHKQLQAIVVVLATIVASACSGESQAPMAVESKSSFNYDHQIGIANINERDGCLATANPSIKSGTKVTLVDQPSAHLAFEPPAITEPTVAEVVPDCDNRHMFSTELSGPGPTYHRLRLEKPWSGNGYLFAIIDPSGPVAINGKNIEGDLDGDGTNESFRICMSSEGAHYQVWTGEPLSGRPRWHWYVYAGYDITPNCTEKEYFGPK